jgi:hypothetical protein
MKKNTEMIEEAILRWPDGMDRTRIKERKSHKAWGGTAKNYREGLAAELGRMGATSILLTRAEDERLDPGVAVWFNLKKEDFSWQQGLGLETPAPTLDQIDVAFRAKAKGCHPDLMGGGDSALFKKINDWRTQAKAWIQGTHDHRREYVMAIDQYTETRLNIQALKMAFFYIRGLERVGAPAILTQTMGAFRAKLTGGSSE